MRVAYLLYLFTSFVFAQEASADQYRVIQKMETATGSRNMGLDPVNHRIFIPAAKFGTIPAGAKRAPVLPGTFAVMVIERDANAH
jgi:hypothetical protein